MTKLALPRDRRRAASRHASTVMERHSRWFYCLAALPPIAGVATTLLSPAPQGHWTEHLSSVGFKTMQLLLLAGLLVALKRRSMSVPMMVALAVVAFGIVLQVTGDLQVANAIWGTTGDPGDGNGYSEGHETSGFGDLLVVLSGWGIAIIVGVRKRVPWWLALCAFVMVIVPPPFLWPAAGVLLLLLHALVSGSTFERRTATDGATLRSPPTTVEASSEAAKGL